MMQFAPRSAADATRTPHRGRSRACSELDGRYEDRSTYDAMPPPTRERLLDAAVDLLQRQGYHGTGLNELLERSEAPRGSLYHYFPGGKEQIGAEAISRAGDQVAAAVAHLLRTNPSVPDAVEALAGLLAAGLEASDFERGCPVATTALEVTPRSEPIRAAVQASFDRWLALVRERLEATGFEREEAGRRADLTIAALEGALVLARARQNADVLRDAGRQLRPLLRPPEA
jgi:TetR/AcrR family transcriptional repressor of lmrAB and yxaGH operons